jgi:ABC-type sugar transport system permease subunit
MGVAQSQINGELRGAAVQAHRVKYWITVLLFVLPAVIGLLVFQYGPLAVAVRNSFYNMALLNPDRASFVGVANYLRMFQEPRFWQSLRNTLTYTAGKIVFEIPLALFLAVVSQRAIRGIGIVRTAVFAPVVTAMSTVAVIWNMMYHPENGLLNSIVMGLGFPRQPYITSATQALPAILFMTLWKDVGTTMLILLGGLQAIPVEFYDAASIDGAGTVELVRYITLPLLKRTLMYAVVVLTIFSFKVFTPIYVMTKGGPQGMTRTTVYYIYEEAFKYMRIGRASALSVMLMVVMVGVAAIQARLLRTEFEY